MKQKIFEVGKKAYTFNQARYEEDMGRCVITAVSERYITDDIGNKFTVSSDDRDYLTAEGNRTLRLYVSEKEALSNWYHLPEWIEEIAERLRNIQIEHKPALDLIREFDSPDSFFYLDPPYLLNTRSAKQYQHEMTEEDHIQLLETIVHCSAQIMISGYDTPLYNDYLHTWDTLRIPNQTTSGVIREEIVWMNYTHQLSLYDFGIL